MWCQILSAYNIINNNNGNQSNHYLLLTINEQIIRSIKFWLFIVSNKSRNFDYLWYTWKIDNIIKLKLFA